MESAVSTIAAIPGVAVVSPPKFEADGVTPRAEFEHSAAKQSQSRGSEEEQDNNNPAGVEGCAHKLAF